MHLNVNPEVFHRDKLKMDHGLSLVNVVWEMEVLVCNDVDSTSWINHFVSLGGSNGHVNLVITMWSIWILALI